MDKNHVLLMPVIEEWALTLDEWKIPLIARGLATRTIETRIRHVRQFSREMAKSPEQVTFQDIILWGANKTWAPETRHGYYTSIKLFFKWFAVTHNLPDPAKDLDG